MGGLFFYASLPLFRYFLIFLLLLLGPDAAPHFSPFIQQL